MEPLETKIWWDYLEEDLQSLIKEAYLLVDVLQGMGADLPGGKREFHDYSFVVFPAAKAYEGFLKKMFLDLGMISEDDFYGKQFRIGKALNPSLPKRIKKEGIYDKIVDYCGGEDLAQRMWNTWKVSRNLVFHWFPNEKNALSFGEATKRIDLIIDTIDQSFKECKIK